MMKNSNTFLAPFFIAVMLFSLSFSALAQDDKYGDNPDECLTNLSLYQGDVKQWKAAKYKGDLPLDFIGPLRACIQNCPRSSQRMYQDAIKVYSRYFLPRAENVEEKMAYIDTIMMLYDMRMEHFPIKKDKPTGQIVSQVGYLLGRKAINLIRLRPDAYEPTYELLKQAVELSGENSEPSVVATYFKMACILANMGELDPGVVVELFGQLSTITSVNITKNEGNQKIESQWITTIESIENEIEPFASCENLTNIYRPKFEQNPNDIATLRKIAQLLDKSNCQDSELFFDVTEKIYSIEPNADAAYLMSSILLKQEQYTEAIQYLTDAVELLERDETKLSAYLKLSNAYYNTQNYPKARGAALEALKINPNNGDAYIIIGNCYVASAKNCGANDFEQKLVYCLAVEQYTKARQVSEVVADHASKMISSYSQYFPKKETIFQYGQKPGDKFQIECWINRSVTIRASN